MHQPSPVVFEQVSFAFAGQQPLLQGFSAEVEAGAITALVGQSGCGKSTLLRLAAGLLRPDVGEVHAEAEARAFVFQAPTLLPWRTVAANVALPLELAHRPEVDARVDRALDDVGLLDARDGLPHELSGGMQMRASLARALATEPSLILLDEPFSGLDALTRKAAHALFLDLWERLGFTALLVTHDIDEALLLSQRVIAVGRRPLAVLGEADDPDEVASLLEDA